MKDIKIAFFDVDGTLMDMKKRVISEKMRETLRKLKENNVLICIASGRGPCSLPVISDVEFDVFITYNGAYCYNADQVIFRDPIPKEDVKKIILNSAKINRPVSIGSADRVVANGKDQNMSEYYAFGKIVVEVGRDFDEVAERDIYQIVTGCCAEEYDAVLKDVAQAKIVAWWDRAVDIIPVNCSKGLGIKKVLDHYHLAKENAIAFGDGTNDIEMLQTVGMGVAMGNALEPVKAIADDVCGSAADDGIYYFCKEKGLI
ncbi:MAG: HAD family hydrolase [Oscillospiraceae bacterium]|nr:HAD family hydrolase [Oscillospiraceae bacterium]